MNLLSDYYKAQDGLKDIKNQKEELQKLIDNIDNSYKDRISALEDERQEAVFKAERTKDEKEVPLNVMKSSYEASIAAVHRIRDLMTVVRDHLEVTPPEVYYYTDKDEKGNYLGFNKKRKIPIDPIRTIKDDGYSIFKLYIVPNKKPVNKYSLILRGYSIFGDLLRGFTFGSISGIHESSCNFYTSVKDAPTQKELLSYAEKHMDKVLAALPDSYDNIVKEYQEAEKFLEDPEWQLFYWEGRKHYYEEGYHRGTETEEYKEVLKNIRQIKSTMKALT